MKIKLVCQHMIDASKTGTRIAVSTFKAAKKDAAENEVFGLACVPCASAIESGTQTDVFELATELDYTPPVPPPGS